MSGSWGCQIVTDYQGPSLKRDKDLGCKHHESCLECPEDPCILDLIQTNPTTQKRLRAPAQSALDRRQAIIEEWQTCKRPSQIASKLGVTALTVRNILKAAGVYQPYKPGPEKGVKYDHRS